MGELDSWPEAGALHYHSVSTVDPATAHHARRKPVHRASTPHFFVGDRVCGPGCTYEQAFPPIPSATRRLESEKNSILDADVSAEGDVTIDQINDYLFGG